MSDESLTLDSRSSALLVMDYQPAILGRLPDADAQVARGAEAIAAARASAMPVAYVRVAFEPADAAAVDAANPVFAAAARSMPADAAATQIDPRIAPQDGDIVVRKTRIGAFSTTDLDAQLRARGVDTLVLAGVSTSGCVLSTYRDAFDRDYRLVVLADGCADVDEEVHRVLLEKVFARHGEVVTVAAFARALA